MTPESRAADWPCVSKQRPCMAAVELRTKTIAVLNMAATLLPFAHDPAKNPELRCRLFGPVSYFVGASGVDPDLQARQ